MREFDFAFYSDIGGRSNNEDAYLAKRLDPGYLFAVADGLGGHEDGELASTAAINAIKEYLRKTEQVVISDAVKYANDMVIKLQSKASANSKMKP